LSLGHAKTLSLSEIIELKRPFSNIEVVLDNKKYIVTKLLGQGNTSKIYEIKADRKTYALRLPKSTGQFNTFSKYEDYIDSFKLGHSTLESQGLRVPRIIDYSEREFVIVERLLLDESFDLEELFFYPETINSTDKENAILALKDFAKQSANFEQIKDFHLKQLSYSPKENKWILIDWTHSHKLANEVDSKQVLDIDLLHSHWRNDVYYRKGGRSEIDKIPDYNPDTSIKNLFKEIDQIVTTQRELNFENPTSKTGTYNKKKIEALYDLKSFDFNKIKESIPSYLVSNNDDLKSVIDALSSHVNALEELEQLLSIRNPLGVRADWKLEQKIQRIITRIDKVKDQNTLYSLLKHPFVSSYAKAYIQRELLKDSSTLSCNSLIKALL
jgi:hypothetical protein